MRKSLKQKMDAMVIMAVCVIVGRHARIMKEIKGLSPDIVTFQEIEIQYFHDHLLPEMAELGYSSVQHLRYAPKICSAFQIHYLNNLILDY